MIFWVIYGFIIVGFIFILYHVIRYRNPYKLFMVFGSKGSGKSTLMTKLALQHLKKGWKVYCDREIPGCYQFKTEDFGKYRFPPNSLILVDEVGLVWDNRNFKNFPEHVKVYFKYQRQYRNKVYLFSQSFDVDKKIRDLTDHLYICQNFFNFVSVARRVTKKITVVHADRSAAGEAKIADDYNIDSLLLFFFGTVKLTYIPRWAKYFKSFDPPDLPSFTGEPLPPISKDGRASWRKALAAASAERAEFMKKMNHRY